MLQYIKGFTTCQKIGQAPLKLLNILDFFAQVPPS